MTIQGDLWMFDHFDQGLSCQAAQALDRLAYRGQRRFSMGRWRDIIEAGHCNLFWDTDVFLSQGAHGAQRHNVAGGEDGIRLEWKQALHRLEAADFGEISFLDQIFING